MTLEIKGKELCAETASQSARWCDGTNGDTLTDGLELRMQLDHIGLVEERDERLIGGLDDHELERVAVECDALERLQDRAERCSAGDFIVHQ